MPAGDKRVPDTREDKKRPAVKQKWQQPRIRTGHLFESNSLACGKNVPQLDQCVQNPTTS